MKEAKRDELRSRVDEARRDEVEEDRRLSHELRTRSPDEIKRQADERKAIFAAQESHDTALQPLAVVARRDRDVYLVSIGGGLGRVLELGGATPSLSPPTEIYTLTVENADWMPFTGDAAEILATAARIIAA